MILLSGTKVAHTIEETLKKRIATLPLPPTLSVILVGNDLASLTYIAMKERACARLGIRSLRVDLPATTTQQELQACIERCNDASQIDGILLQLPLPSHLDPLLAVSAIDPRKDVDGLHPNNMGRLLAGVDDGFVPCTPLGVEQLLLHSQISLPGKEVVIVGRSQLVGRPLAALLSRKAPQANATVTLAHSQTRNLEEVCRRAEILIVAAGHAGLVKAEMVREGAVVVDVGIHRSESRVLGDVDFDSVAPKCHAISPVPGGVGPMTIVMLMQNTLKAAQIRTQNLNFELRCRQSRNNFS